MPTGDANTVELQLKSSENFDGQLAFLNKIRDSFTMMWYLLIVKF